MGVTATNDADALIALAPDCVVYAASGPQRDAAAVPDYVRLLRAGINVVSTSSTSLVYPPSYVPEGRSRLEDAAVAGNASFYASGVFPGFASDQLALLMTTQSKKIRTVKVTEVALNDHYPVADVMMDGMGFGRALEFEPMLKTPGFIEMAWKAPIHLIAAGLGVEVEEVRGSLDRRLTSRDIQVAFGTIPAGTCGAVCTRAVGVVNGREAIVVEHIIRMARDVAPDWLTSESDATYRVDIEGDPGHSLRNDVGGGRGPRCWTRRDGIDRDESGQRHSVRRRGTGRSPEFARHSDDPAAIRVRLGGCAYRTMHWLRSSRPRIETGWIFECMVTEQMLGRNG